MSGLTRLVSIPSKYTSTPIFDAHPKFGICEVHLNFSNDLLPIRGPADFAGENDIHTSMVRNTDCIACKGCREKMIEKYKSIQTVTELDIFGETIRFKDLSPQLKLIIECALDIKEIFPNIVENIYIIPEESVPAEFKGKLNLVFAFQTFVTLGYLCWAVKSGQSLFSLWDENSSNRTKFWSEMQTRVILGLAKVHHTAKNTAIWVMGYDRILSIEAFSASPPRIIKLSKPYKLMKVKRDESSS